MIQLGTNYSASAVAELGELLQKMAECAIGLSTAEDFELVQNAIVGVDNHLTLYFSVEAPSQDMLVAIRRPLLWIHQRNINKHVLHVININGIFRR